jgi:hypothetical protein
MADVEMKDAPVKDAEKTVPNVLPSPQEAQALLVAGTLT